MDRREDATLGLPLGFFDKPRRERVRCVSTLVSRPGMDKTLSDTMKNWYTGGNPASVHVLTTVVTRDPDIAVQRYALSALGRIPDPAVIPGLLRGLQSPHRVCRMHAILALGRVDAREGVPRLIELLNDQRSRTVVAQTLVAIRDKVLATKLLEIFGWLFLGS